jgi:predicted GIY-YIG superfamily endonuclease
MNTVKTKEHYWLYVLELEQGKYYVGVTSKTPEIRMKQHTNGRGAYWTQKYKPIRLFDKKDLGYISYVDAEAYENKMIRAYLEKFGVNNTRGGDLTDVDDMVKRFGWYRDKDKWQAGVAIIFLMMIILALFLKTVFR